MGKDLADLNNETSVLAYVLLKLQLLLTTAVFQLQKGWCVCFAIWTWCGFMCVACAWQSEIFQPCVASLNLSDIASWCWHCETTTNSTLGWQQLRGGLTRRVLEYAQLLSQTCQKRASPCAALLRNQHKQLPLSRSTNSQGLTVTVAIDRAIIPLYFCLFVKEITVDA